MLPRRKVNTIYNDLVADVSETLGDGRTMDSQLTAFGKLVIGRTFKGVFASDQIPKLTGRGTSYMIVNVDKAGMSGSHWLGMVAKGKRVYYYDSFGRPIQSLIPDTARKLRSESKSISSSASEPEQSIIEDNCGQRTMAWLILFHRLGVDNAIQISE